MVISFIKPFFSTQGNLCAEKAIKTGFSLERRKTEIKANIKMPKCHY